MRTLLHVLAATFLAAGISHAAALSGTITDGETGEPLISANVYLDGTPFGSMSGPGGEYRIDGVPPGRYTVTASHVGYTVSKRSVTLGDETVELAFTLRPEILSGQTVVVTASRAKERQTPVTFSNLTREDIEARYSTQDVPMMLQTLPSVHAYSDAGNGIGYSYLNIRGFDQQRINVLINGIPHNGPASHQVYWVNMPDLLANAEDVQVQRGIGSSLHGTNALGGTVNIITSNFGMDPSVSFYTGVGSYNTQRYSIAYNSGLVANRYVMYGRFSRITSDGYRDQSWTRLSSYFLGVARYDENMTTKINVYGGPEETHLAYRGVPREYLDGDITGDPRVDRRHNPLTYENETDNFSQPHYELHHDWMLSDRLQLSNTLYTIKGKGNFTQYRENRRLEEFRVPEFTVKDPDLYNSRWYRRDAQGQPVMDSDGNYTIIRSDLIRNRWGEYDEYGWQPRVEFDHGSGTLTFGGEVRLHQGDHWAYIDWFAAAPPDIGPSYEYYRYRVRKRTFSAFVHESYRLTPRVTLMGDIQAINHTYMLDNDKMTKYEFEASYRWLSPKAGVNFNITDRINVFGSVAYTEREPVIKDLVDPQDYWNTPNFSRIDTVRSGGEVTAIRLSDPTVDTEKVVNFELGAGYRSERIRAGVNLYHMDFRNEIVPWVGQINEASGLPATGNADRSVHQGVELEFATLPVPSLEISGNLNVNNDHFVKYTENATDWDAYVPVPVVRDGNRIAGFPTMLANLRASYGFHGFTVAAAWRYVGRQYLDNSENVDYSIDPYNVTDLTLGYSFGARWGIEDLTVELRVNNVFDTLYSASGYMDDVYAVAAEGQVYGTPYYIPAATRNVFASLKWRMR